MLKRSLGLKSPAWANSICQVISMSYERHDTFCSNVNVVLILWQEQMWAYQWSAVAAFYPVNWVAQDYILHITYMYMIGKYLLCQKALVLDFPPFTGHTRNYIFNTFTFDSHYSFCVLKCKKIYLFFYRKLSDWKPLGSQVMKEQQTSM